MKTQQFFGGAVVVGLALWLGSCAGPAAGDGAGGPIADSPTQLTAIVANTATPDESRQAADAKLKTVAGPTSAARLAVLEQIVWAPGNSDDMRIYALDQIKAADPARAGRVLMLYLPRMESWPALRHACAMAVTLGDVRVEGALVRALARPATSMKLRDRPEAAALESLSAEPLNAALWDKLVQARDTSARVAALDVLRQLEGPAAVRARIVSLAAPDAFLAALQAWGRDFDGLPEGPQEVAWALELQTPAYAELRAAALTRHIRLMDHADYVPELRGVHLLAHVPPRLAGQSRQQLMQMLAGQLGTLQHVRRAAHYPGSADDRDESLEKNAAKLTRIDLLKIAVLTEALKSPTLRATILRLGMDDMTDETSEHGGLLRIASAADQPVQVTATLYPPLYTGNDQAYVSGDKLMAETLDGLAQFHLHFQQVFNGANAGPGDGDVAYAAANRVDGVVFTSVGKGQFDADYYTPAGAVVDLGVYGAAP